MRMAVMHLGVEETDLITIELAFDEKTWLVQQILCRTPDKDIP